MTEQPSSPSAASAHDDDEAAYSTDFVGFVAAEEALVESAPAKGPLLRRLSALMGPFVRFALVGGVGFLIETAVFNLLLFTVLSPTMVPGGEIWAKVTATLVAIITNWIGNRLWTFRHSRRSDRAKEGVEFFGVSLVGLLVGLIPIWFTSQVLGLQDWLPLNIANIAGLVLGSIFRFVCYRWWVFSPSRKGSAARRRDEDAASEDGAGA